MLVDRRRRTAGIGRKDLGGTPRRSQQDTRDLILPHRGDHRRNCRRLARTGIAIDNQDISVVRGDEIRNIPQQTRLAGRRCVVHMGEETLLQEICTTHFRERVNNMDRTARTG